TSKLVSEPCTVTRQGEKRFVEGALIGVLRALSRVQLGPAGAKVLAPGDLAFLRCCVATIPVLQQRLDGPEPERRHEAEQYAQQEVRLLGAVAIGNQFVEWL